MKLPSQSHPAPQLASPLALILDDLADAGVRATPLNIIARCTDLEMSDAMVSAVIAQLAAGGDLNEIAA